jgi:hypothetical protein
MIGFNQAQIKYVFKIDVQVVRHVAKECLWIVNFRFKLKC